MKAEYSYSKDVLDKLGYSTEEFNEIKENIEKGNFAYCHKNEYDKHSIKWDKYMKSCVGGIDIPTLWCPNEDNYIEKTFLLLAQDPLRNEKYWEFCENENKRIDKIHNVIIGTPYALHVDANRSEKENRIRKSLRLNVGIYRNLIDKIVSDLHSRVYCTDIFKCFPLDKKIETFEIGILKDEIEKVQPDFIICMGKFAQNAMDLLKDEITVFSDEKILNIPHPKARSTSWSKWRANNNIQQNKNSFTDKDKVSDIITFLSYKIKSA